MDAQARLEQLSQRLPIAELRDEERWRGHENFVSVWGVGSGGGGGGWGGRKGGVN
jgi:hypothetical protein